MDKISIIKNRVGLEDCLAIYGIEVRNRRLKCPIHNGDNYSCSIGKTGNIVCPVCNKTYSVIDLVMHKENCDITTAIKILAQKFGISELLGDITPEERRRMKEIAEKRKIEKERQEAEEKAKAEKLAPEYRRKWNRHIMSLTDTAVSHAYLMGRGISKFLCEKYRVRDCRIQVIDYKVKPEKKWLEPACMIPYSLGKNEFWFWKRSTVSKEFRKTPAQYIGHEPLFNYPAVELAIMGRKKLFVAESPLDALSAEQLWGNAEVEYVSGCGSTLTSLWAAIGNGLPIKVVGGFDNDEVGERLSRECELECEKRGITYQRFEFDKDCKDINDYLKKKLSKNT